MDSKLSIFQELITLVDLPPAQIKSFLDPYISNIGKTENELTIEDVRLILSDVIHDIILNKKPTQ